MGKVFRKHGADNDRIWTLVAALLVVLLALAVWLHPLHPRALDLTIASLLIVGFAALWKTRNTLGWFASLSMFIALSRLLAFPWSGVAATLLLIAFLALSRPQIADALLPVRAYFVRKKAQKR